MSQNKLLISIQVYISLVEKYWNKSQQNLIHLFIYLNCKTTKSIEFSFAPFESRSLKNVKNTCLEKTTFLICMNSVFFAILWAHRPATSLYVLQTGVAGGIF